MFDVGFTELMLIGVVALVVIGPERLPAVARTVGTYVGKLQRFVTGVKRDIRHELESGELKDLIGDQKQQIDELRKMVNTTRRDLEKDTREVVAGARRKFAEVETSAKGEGAESKGAPAAPSAPAVSLDKDDSRRDATTLPVEPPSVPADAAVAPPAVSMTDRVPGTPAAPSAGDAADEGRSRASGG